jgi:hypothetical protein
MGRPCNPVRKCFQIDPTTGAQICKGCGQGASNVVERLKVHASACKHLHSRGLWKPPGTGAIQRAFYRQDQKWLGKVIARMMVASNLPFRWVESPAAVEMFSSLAPGVRVVGRAQISGPILEELYNEERSKFAMSMAGKRCTLECDGWHTVDHIPVVGFGLMDTLIHVCSERESHTAAFLAKQCQEQVFTPLLCHDPDFSSPFRLMPCGVNLMPKWWQLLQMAPAISQVRPCSIATIPILPIMQQCVMNWSAIVLICSPFGARPTCSISSPMTT